jgi:hypothetical protein
MAFFFWTHSGLLYDRVRLDERFPMGPRSISGDENSLRYDLGEWVLASSKAVNVACLAVFDPSTNNALSRQPESARKFGRRPIYPHMKFSGGFGIIARSCAP